MLDGVEVLGHMIVSADFQTSLERRDECSRPLNHLRSAFDQISCLERIATKDCDLDAWPTYYGTVSTSWATSREHRDSCAALTPEGAAADTRAARAYRCLIQS